MPLEVLSDPSSATPPHKTEVGSYFVSNYPPFSAWSAGQVPEAEKALDSEPNLETKLGLYLHIPFCRKRCKFCYFRVYTDKNASDVDIYTDTLAKEIQMYAARRGIGKREFEFVYFGGGTPSFLSNDQLKRLVDKIRESWSWAAAREVTFECEPGTLKESKLKTIKEIGVTRLSLGVEHFDDEVLALNGRAHRSPEVFKAYDWARSMGFHQINIDLIAGMLGETEDKWKMTVEKALAMAPDSVTIYQMEVPFNTVIAKEAKQEAGVASAAHLETPVAGWDDKRRWVSYAFDLFTKAGYVVSSAYTMVKPGPHAGFVYRDSMWRGADMVGTGVASFSHFQGVHYQNVDTWEQYLERVSRGELPIHRALAITDHQRLIREMILQMKTGKIQPSYFKKKFGEDILQVFGGQFAGLQSEGFAEISGDQVALTRAGLLRADELLSRFFEPQFQNIRYT